MKNPKKKRILITGSQGRIGRDLAIILGKYYEIVSIDIGDELSEKHFNNIYGLIHLAAKTPVAEGVTMPSTNEYIETNASLTKRVIFFAVKNKVRKIIIPTTWSWAFKVGDYQYSKLLQEKIALAYQKSGLDIFLIELPEVINQNYKGIINKLLEKIKNGEQTTVDQIDIEIISTENIALVCHEYLKGNQKKALKMFGRLKKKINIYKYIKDLIERDYPDKLEYLKPGKEKSRICKFNKNRTINFPDFEYE
jgi:nucleoside-diphosphate-sugar epimerase